MKGKVKEFRYIFNISQANYYLENGLIPIGFGVGSKKDVYIKFKDSKELQDVFSKWMDRKYN